jgi:hypothetical protein
MLPTLLAERRAADEGLKEVIGAKRAECGVSWRHRLIPKRHPMKPFNG